MGVGLCPAAGGDPPDTGEAGDGQDGVDALRESVGTVGSGPCCGCIWCVTFGDNAGCPGRGSQERPWGLRDELTVWTALCSVDKKATAAVGRRKRVSRASRDSGPHWPRGAGGAGGRWAPRTLELGSRPLASGKLLLSAS